MMMMMMAMVITMVLRQRSPVHPISTSRIRRPKLRMRTSVAMKTPTALTMNTVSASGWLAAIVASYEK